MKASVFLAPLGLVMGLAIAPHVPAAAPLCSGEASVSALGADGCEFGNVTLSGFIIRDAFASFGTPTEGIDPDNILISISLGTLSTGLFEGIPAITVGVRPSEASYWIFSGLAQGIRFTLDYSVSIASPLEEFALYQLRAFGNGPFRAGGWSVVKNVTNGSGAFEVTQSGPFIFSEYGTFTPGVESFDVSDTMAVGSAFPFTGSVGSFLNAFTVRVVPEPGTAVLMLVGLGAIASRRRG